MIECLHLVIPATPSAIPAVTDDVIHFLESCDWSQDEILKVDLALQEALANGIRHGCKGDPSKHVQCFVSCEDTGDVMIVVRDEGAGFDVAAVPDPLSSVNLLKPSGRGVFLINQLMDEVAFADGGREVRMRRHRRL
jgi:serine/threonine-protein kinase RsbW